MNPDGHADQALNCLLIETPAGRVLVETGMGDRMDDRRQRRSRGCAGKSIVPALEQAGFDADTVDVVAVSHLHFDHAGGLMTPDGSACIPARADRCPGRRMEVRAWHNPRLQASYEQDDLQLAEPWANVGSPDGDEEVLPGVWVRRTGGHSGGHQAIVVRGARETVGFFGDLCMRPWSANPRWIPSFDDFPLTWVEVKASLFREAAEEGWTVVLSHEPRKPVGRLIADRDRYRFESSL